ncbi:low affinity immunoglobulin gamma Fc region receptor III-A-like [Odontesthes bonariensis]|uniref:low affinity immunoglobulin gamma Fc region receptor III-A-like isoform X2 n=1 Tax=Odontesthes bonariensis TaxID=219752 RepID=UPI003F585FA8
MKVAALCLLFLMMFMASDQAKVSLKVTPPRSQFFKYDSFSVSCDGENGEEGVAGWRVMKRMTDREVHPCQHPCTIRDAFPVTDSGEYWCETGLGATSSNVNITVTAGSVILESPVHPATEGVNVTLRCRCKPGASACNLASYFYKDGLLVKNSSTGSMTIRNISRSDQGSYKCSVFGFGDSQESWLTVKAPPAGQDPSATRHSVSTLVRHLVVGAPYLLSTILLGLIYKDRKRKEKEWQTSQAGQACDDVIMEVIQ